MHLLQISVESFREALANKNTQFQQQHPKSGAIKIPPIEWMQANKVAFEEEQTDDALTLKEVDQLGFKDEEVDYKGQVISYTSVSLHDVWTTMHISDNLEADDIKTFDLSCARAQGNLSVGKLQGHHIDPKRFEFAFWYTMHICSSDCKDLASIIFDEQSWIKAEWNTDPRYKGSGVWQGLGFQKFMLIKEITVDLEHARMELGTHMFQIILNEAEKRGAAYVYTNPTRLKNHIESSHAPIHCAKTSEERQAVMKANVLGATKFCRALGFRRIGSSDWFCFVMNPKHPARKLAAEDDFDP